jgi:hypothetical protein
MSTRSSIWLGESEGKSVHIYWELADRELGGERMRAPSTLPSTLEMRTKKLRSGYRKRLRYDS